MTVWSLTTDTDTGLMTNLYLSEGLAYDALIRYWTKDGSVAQQEAFAALAQGIPEVGESAISRWFADYLERTCSDDRFTIERHDHPWVFTAE